MGAGSASSTVRIKIGLWTMYVFFFRLWKILKVLGITTKRRMHHSWAAQADFDAASPGSEFKVTLASHGTSVSPCSAKDSLYMFIQWYMTMIWLNHFETIWNPSRFQGWTTSEPPIQSHWFHQPLPACERPRRWRRWRRIAVDTLRGGQRPLNFLAMDGHCGLSPAGFW